MFSTTSLSILQRCTLFLFLLFSLSLVWGQTPRGDAFKVGMVADEFGTYTPQDTEIKEGVYFWAKWVNDRGGLFYNNSYHDVQVLTLDASTSNSNRTTSLVTAAYEELATQNKVNLMVCPTTTGRTNPALKVSEKYGIINFVVSALTESLFTSNNSYIFTSVPDTSVLARAPFDPLIAQGAKTYVLQQRTDAYSVIMAKKTTEYLASKGLVCKKSYWVNASSVDSDAVNIELRNAIRNELAGIEADIFVTNGLITEWPMISTVFDVFTPNVKAAVFLNTLATNAQEAGGIGNIGDYWIAATRFDPRGTHGVSGENGGTTAEFVAAFKAQFGHPPVVNSAIGAALLMSYSYAVNVSGSINATVIRKTLKTMGKIETFAMAIEYQNNGTNKYPEALPMQMKNGTGIVQQGNMIYPAAFDPIVNTTITTNKKSNPTVIIAVVVPVAVIVIVLAAIASIYVRRQKTQVVKALVDVEEGERRNYKISFSELTTESAIGAGGFGVVYRGEYRGAEVAVKRLKAQLSKTQLTEFAREASIMVGLRHPNILLFMGVCLEPHSLCIVTEYMSRGSLYDIIQNKKIAMPFPLIKRMLADTLKGLQYIHSSGMIHRDLKSPNLLVDRSWNIKIADFGLSVTKAESNNATQLSLLWSAPETLIQEKDCYSEKSDIYSFAIIVWEMMARRTPYDDMMAAAIAPAVMKGQRPPISEKWMEGINGLMRKCWDHDPAKRFTVKEARAHVDDIYADPDFNVGGSSTLETYIELVAPPSGECTFVSTTVCHSEKLWEHEPHTMVKSLILHNQLLRETMQQTQGCEVTNNSDSFLIAFSKMTDAMNFCLRVQNALLKISWPAGLLSHPDAIEQRGYTSDVVLYRGITVSMGMHQVNAVVEKDREGRVKYIGGDTHFASILAYHAVPGTIAMNSEMYARVVASANRVDPFSMVSLGERQLTSNANMMHLYQATPKQLDERNSQDYIDTTKSNLVLGSLMRSESNRFPVGTEKWVIRFSELELGERIGAGSFGEVKLGKWKGQKVAVKELLKQKVEDNALLEIRAESVMLCTLQHTNIINFLGMCMEAPHMALITEYMEKGDLAKLLYNPSNMLSWDIRRKMAKDMASGMAYLHEKNIWHRDIKTSNMLVAADYTVKIADFGFSRMKADNQTMTQQGTVAWTAPEIFEGDHYTEKCDVYSFGIVLWELCARRKPWEGNHNMKVVALVTCGQRPSVANLDAPHDILKLMQECWAPDPKMRPTFATVVSLL